MRADLSTEPPSLHRGCAATTAANVSMCAFPLGRIDIHRIQIIAAARRAKPVKWMVRRS